MDLKKIQQYVNGGELMPLGKDSTKSRRGRPKKAPNELRSKHIHILCTEYEKKTIERFAKEAGEETSTWARSILLKANRQH